MSKDENNLRTWIEVSRSAIRHNVGVFRSLLKSQTKLMAVVKSNAYGHSLIDFAKVMKQNRVDWLGVDSVVEGLALRKAGITLPILILGHTLPARMADAAAQNLSVTVSTLETLSAFLRQKGKHPRFHLKIDTGMHRQGFQLSELPKTLTLLKALDPKHKKSLEGVFTHFAAAKNPAFPQYTERQLSEFLQWTNALRKAGFSPLRHAAATGGALLFPDSHFDMVRIGIGLYGLWPSAETQANLRDRISLRPALSWKTVISELKRLPKGSKIGYDCTETLSRDSVVAVCPIGYWHGYSRKLSGIGSVLVRGKQCRVLGRVSMDMITIDVTGVGARVGDEVVLIGQSGKERVTATDMANLDETSHYETITRLNPLIRRVYR